MKKVMTLLFVASVITFASCGGKKAETTEPATTTEETVVVEEVAADTAVAPVQ